ncbi:MAG: mucoidy inhibitor MuiA family protein [Chloroflexia bacterium]|nr:mucoidy inhibitor MuiA family protein [Chloroflexia bacterium]
MPGTNTILDNYEEHKIGITNIELEAELEYRSIPKLNPFAYLTSKSKNTSDYPLLAGKTNIFLDNSFVSHSNLKLVAPNEEFKTSLGIDEGIHIEHKLINRFQKMRACLAKKQGNFEYKIEIKNNKKQGNIIIVKDQIPISQNQDIKVELLEPKIKENTDLLKNLMMEVLSGYLVFRQEKKYGLI